MPAVKDLHVFRNRKHAAVAAAERSLRLAGAAWAPVAALLLPAILVAAELDPAGWTMSGPNADSLQKAIDDDLGTVWQSDGPQVPGSHVIVDLGQDAYVYGLFLTPGKELSRFPRSLKISVGDSLETLHPATSTALYQATGEGELSKAGDEKPYFPYYTRHAPSYLDLYLQPEWNVRFQPIRGRYVKIAIGDNGAGMPWAIAEMDISGIPLAGTATKPVEPGRQMAVIMDESWKERPDGHLMQCAAEDLQYYLMGMLAEPVRLVPVEEAGTCTGMTFRLLSPPEEPAIYPEPDPTNLDDVVVTRVGDEVRFGGLTTRAVVYGVYEFLARQGVRWVFPESHAEIVPRRKALDLDILPLSYHPPFGRRGYNVSPPYFDFAQAKSPLDSRFAVRNGVSFGAIPRDNVGFGSMHTMGQIFTTESSGQRESSRLTHPEWWPTKSSVPCTSNPEVLEHVIARMNEDDRVRTEKKRPAVQGYGVSPDDAATFCTCERCVRMFGTGEQGGTPACDPSDQYFYLIDELAKRLKAEHPTWFLRAAAYERYVRPPQRIDKLPDNVAVDMMPVWQQTLPSTSPQNLPIRTNLENWGSKCASPSFGIWSYMLIYLDNTFSRSSGEWNALVPNAGAIMEQMRFYRQIGVRSVGTQVMGPQHHWPWGFYAWGRTAWNPDADPEEVLTDFFKGYYGEAWEPMLAWYKAMENEAHARDIGSVPSGGSAPNAELFTEELTATMRGLGAQAQKRAKRWYVKERVARALADLEWTHRKARWKSEEPPMVYPCHRLAKPPTVDGTIDDEAWSTVPECRGFRSLATRLGPDRPGRFDFRKQTRFRVGHDDEFVYLAMTCGDPNIAKVVESDKDPNARRESLEISFGTCGLAITSSGSAGRLRDGAVAKTAYNANGWTLEAKFPIGTSLQEGTRWPAAMTRWSFSGGEWGTTWSDLLQFQGLHGGLWANASHLEIRNASLDSEKVRQIEGALNREFDLQASRYDENRTRLADFDEKTRGMKNLADPKTSARHSNTDSYSRYYEIAWKEPVEFDAVRIPATWHGLRQVRPWFTLEWWDGSQYHLIAEVRDNAFETRVFEFPPIKSSRLRLNIWDDRSHREGWHDSRGLLSPMEVFKTR
jgi:hypothetical protein